MVVSTDDTALPLAIAECDRAHDGLRPEPLPWRGWRHVQVVVVVGGEGGGRLAKAVGHSTRQNWAL